MSKIFFSILFILLTNLFNAQNQSDSEHLNLDDKVAIQGYDPVAYFDQTAVKGQEKYVQHLKVQSTISFQKKTKISFS